MEPESSRGRAIPDAGCTEARLMAESRLCFHGGTRDCGRRLLCHAMSVWRLYDRSVGADAGIAAEPFANLRLQTHGEPRGEWDV